MYSTISSISCGITQLCDIGDNPSQIDYDVATRWIHESAMVVASLTTKQQRGLKLLRKNGFKRIGRAKKNPNTGNNIVLLVKRVKQWHDRVEVP